MKKSFLLFETSALAVVLSSLPYFYFLKGQSIAYIIPGAVISFLFPLGLLNYHFPTKKHLPLLLYIFWMSLAYIVSGSSSGSFALRTVGYSVGAYVTLVVMARVFSKSNGLVFLEIFLSLFSITGLVFFLLYLVGLPSLGIIYNMRIPYLGLKPIKSLVFGPNYFSALAFMGFALSYYLWRVSLKFFHLGLLVVNLLALFLSFSRAAYLALALFLLVEMSIKKTRLFLPFLALVLAFVIAFPGFLQLKKGMTGREVIWPLAWELIMEAPAAGWGTEVKTVFAKTNIKWSSAHNSFLDFGIMYGLVGMVLYFFLFVAALAFSFRKKDPLHRFLIPLIPSLFVLSLFSTFVVGGFSIGSVLTGIFLGIGFLE